MNFATRCVAAFYDRRWDDGTRSRPHDDEFGGTVSLSWGMGLEFSSRIRVPSAGGGGFFSSFARTGWDHACTSWADDRGMSSMAAPEPIRDLEPDYWEAPAFPPTLRLVTKKK